MCKPCVQSVVTLWDFRSFIYHIIPTDLAYWTHSDVCLPQCGIYWTMCKPCAQSVVTLWDFRSFIYHIIPTDLAYWTHSDLCLPKCDIYWTMCKPCVQSVVTLWGFRSWIYHIIPQTWHTEHTVTCWVELSLFIYTRLKSPFSTEGWLPQCGIYWTMCKPCVQSVVTLWDFRSFIYHIIPTYLAY